MGSDEAHAPAWRSPAWLGAAAAVLTSLTGVAALIVNAATEDDGSQTITSSEGSADSPVPGAVDAEPSEDASTDDYWTSDGSVPRISQDCYGLLGYCLGSPVNVVLEQLGPEAVRFPGANPSELVRVWDLDEDSRISVTSDDIDSIAEASTSGSDDFRLALANGLVLGNFTIRQLLAHEGPPDEINLFGGDGLTILTYAYCRGPERSITVEYSLSVEWVGDIGQQLLNYETSPQVAVELVGGRPLNGYRVRQRGTAGVTETC